MPQQVLATVGKRYLRICQTLHPNGTGVLPASSDPLDHIPLLEPGGSHLPLLALVDHVLFHDLERPRFCSPSALGKAVCCLT